MVLLSVSNNASMETTTSSPLFGEVTPVERARGYTSVVLLDEKECRTWSRAHHCAETCGSIRSTILGTHSSSVT